jgi:hypothetical protein
MLTAPRAAGAGGGRSQRRPDGSAEERQGADRVERAADRRSHPPFRSRIRATLPRWTEALEAMAVETSARGLSTRDIEALFAHETDTSLLSRSTVSLIRELLWAEYQEFIGEFIGRGLSTFDVVALVVEGIAERLHRGQPRAAVLARLLREASWRPAAGICPRRRLARKTTSRPASHIGAARSAIDGPSARPICTTACPARRGGALRCSLTPAASAPS